MQTFLPYESFAKTAAILDYRRLGKQRVEAYQILRALRGESKGWVNHPATRMWAGYESALAGYGFVMCTAWLARGYQDTLRPYFRHIQVPDCDMPPWLGDEDFHLSHQSNLIRKMPDYYKQLFPGIPDDMPYLWPVPRETAVA